MQKMMTNTSSMGYLNIIWGIMATDQYVMSVSDILCLIIFGIAEILIFKLFYVFSSKPYQMFQNNKIISYQFVINFFHHLCDVTFL